MSQSPETSEEDASDYLAGWYAMNALMRQGYSWSGHERNVCFLNTGAGAFATVSSASGFDFEDDGRGLVAADWDADGDLDLVVTNRTGPRVRLLRNELEGGDGFVALLLEGDGGNTGAIGARVELALADGRTLARARRAGEGFLAQGSAWLTFGLRDAAVERVTVRWPGGEAEEFEGVQRGGRFVLRQGAGVAEVPPAPGAKLALAPAPCEAPKPSGRTRLVLPAPVPMPALAVVAQTGAPGRVFGVRPFEMSGTGRPLLLSLWSRTCAPCVVELRELAEAKEQLAAAGLDVMALGVDGHDAEAREASAAFLEALDWPYWQATAGEGTLDVLDVLQGALIDSERRIALPTSFLIHPAGDLLAVYTGRVEVARVLADLALVRADPNARRAAAVPFDGRWRGAPPELDLGYFEQRFRRRGLEDTAREFGLGNVRVVERSPAEMLLNFARANLRAGRWKEAVASFRGAVEVEPQNLGVRAELAGALRVAGEVDESVAICDDALRGNEAFAPLWYERGLSEQARGAPAAAQRSVEKLRALGSPLAERLERALEAGG